MWKEKKNNKKIGNLNPIKFIHHCIGLFSCFFPLCFLIRNDDILCFALLHHSMFMLCICYGANNFLTIIILFLRFLLLLSLLPAHNSLLNIKFNILFFFYSYTRVLASSSYTYILSYLQISIFFQSNCFAMIMGYYYTYSLTLNSTDKWRERKERNENFTFIIHYQERFYTLKNYLIEISSYI